MTGWARLWLAQQYDQAGIAWWEWWADGNY